jgi:type IV secretion system protein VirD4
MTVTDGNVQFVLDEMPVLGHMPAIDDALGIGRAYRVRLQLYFQSVGQLRQCFPDGREQTLFSNTSQIFFAVNDHATAEHVSNRLGEHTIIVESGGTSRAYTRQWNDGMHSSHGGSDSATGNTNWQQQARKLLKPEEVIALPPRAAITFTPGVPPLLTWLLRYYEEPALLRKPRRRPAKNRTEAGLLFVSISACALLLAFAASITPEVARILNSL